MKEVQTRSQQQMRFALEMVQQVARKYPEPDRPVRKIYGGLCHNFPVLVRTCGLCQAVAFSVDKAGASDSENKEDKNRAIAHQLHLQHVAGVLGINEQQLMNCLLNAPLDKYMRYTRNVLSAWVYFKRFARSILKVEPGGNTK